MSWIVASLVFCNTPGAEPQRHRIGNDEWASQSISQNYYIQAVGMSFGSDLKEYHLDRRVTTKLPVTCILGHGRRDRNAEVAWLLFPSRSS